MNDIYNLVLSGGGFRGVAFIGVYKYLQKKKILKNLKAISGCSAGAIFGLLINIGCNYEYLLKYIIEFNFEELKDFNYINILDKYGIEPGEKIINKIKDFLIEKEINPDITFKELYELTKIKLYINTICLNDYSIIYNSVDNEPDMPVLFAVRMSISIPFIFTPILYNNRLHIDGGLIDNIPASIFNNEKKNTLILELSNFKLNNEINDFVDYSYNVILCMFYHIRDKSNNYDDFNLIKIHTKNISNLIYELSLNNKLKLIKYGFNAAREFYKDKLFYIVPLGAQVSEVPLGGQVTEGAQENEMPLGDLENNLGNI